MVARPIFIPSTHIWLEMGGVFALPGLRGGGEKGDAWHEAGKGRNKGVAVRDLIAAAQWLVQEGYSSVETTVVTGMSATGSMAASALVQSPSDFGAGVFRITQLDMLRHRSPKEEFGDMQIPEDFEALLNWSPYQNAKPQNYPPVLVQVGDNDTLAPAWHGYKFVAALQHAQQAKAPIYLQVAWGAGHSQGFGIPAKSRTYALQYAFLVHQLELKFHLP
jgi:prolyl oligopeptidase